jgi:hypothetical protein
VISYRFDCARGHNIGTQQWNDTGQPPLPMTACQVIITVSGQQYACGEPVERTVLSGPADL